MHNISKILHALLARVAAAKYVPQCNVFQQGRRAEWRDSFTVVRGYLAIFQKGFLFVFEYNFGLFATFAPALNPAAPSF
jgi:hypothetical protein